MYYHQTSMAALINSKNFASTCDLHLDPFYNTDMIIPTMSPKRVFITGEDHIFQRCLTVLKKFSPKYELVYHRTDSTFDRFKFESIKPYVSHIYAENCEIQDPMITQLPLGFVVDNTPTAPPKKPSKKNHICYVNLGLYNDRELQFIMCRSLRMDCIDHFKKKKFALVEEGIPHELFMKRLRESKFVLCPMGYGIDTHRFYETLFVGSIPIVMTSGLDPLYKKFGALIVQSWDEVTEELLEKFEQKPVDYSLFELSTWVSDK